MRFNWWARNKRTRSFLNVEKPISVLWLRQKTRLGSAENSITIARNHAVCGIAQDSGKQLQRGSNYAPKSSQGLQHEDRRIGTGFQTLIGLIRINSDIESIQVLRIRSMAGQDARSQGTLERGKAENTVRVSQQDKLIHPVAEPADAVVKQDGVGHALDLLDDSSIFVPTALDVGVPVNTRDERR